MRTYADVCCCAGAGKEVVSRSNLKVDVCARMLTYAHVCSRMLLRRGWQGSRQPLEPKSTDATQFTCFTSTKVRVLKRCCCAGVGKEVISRLSTNLSSNAYDVCSRMRTYADLCARMLTYLRGCKEVVSSLSTILSSNAYDVCARMRTYADVCCCSGVGKEVVSRLSTNLSSNAYFLTDSNGRDMVRMLTYADVCCRMLTYADVCCRMLPYADVCCYLLTSPHKLVA
jgi:hypothetical protein